MDGETENYTEKFRKARLERIEHWMKLCEKTLTDEQRTYFLQHGTLCPLTPAVQKRPSRFSLKRRSDSTPADLRGFSHMKKLYGSQ